MSYKTNIGLMDAPEAARHTALWGRGKWSLITTYLYHLKTTLSINAS